MTAKQKANAQRFKKAVAEAKKIRAKNPKLTQPQAVKQAWAILYKTGKVAGTKKPVKKSTSKSDHKDTKSHNVRISVVSGIGKAGDYAKFEIATIKALAKLLKKSIKATQILVNNDQTILNIISNSFDKNLTPTQTAKVIKADLMPAETKDPLKAFVKILGKKTSKATKANFPMKLPATVTIGSVKKLDINFGVYCKGKRILLTKSVTTAINEAKYISSSLGIPAYIKSGTKVFSKFVNGKLIK